MSCDHQGRVITRTACRHSVSVTGLCSSTVCTWSFRNKFSENNAPLLELLSPSPPSACALVPYKFTPSKSIHPKLRMVACPKVQMSIGRQYQFGKMLSVESLRDVRGM
jgi:hypothetical protein